MKDIVGEGISGAISVIKGNQIVFQQSYGYADEVNERLNKLDTKFQSASAGKVFVAVAILQLIDKNKLDFEDTLGKLLKFDLKKISPNITLRQLLTHTSGIPDYFDESIMDEYAKLWEELPNYKIRSSQDLIPLFVDKPMMYSPGERFQYNNTGYVVLGLIIESVTGEAFDKYLEENIFKVCGMRDTGYYELDRLPKGCANAYIYDEEREEYYTNIYSIDAKGSGAGGAFVTVLDIDKFWEGLITSKLLSVELTTQMLSIQASDGQDYYGYGVWLKKEKSGEFSPYIEGCDPGVSFISRYNLRTASCVSVVSNYGENVWAVAGEIERIN